jgi:hypothetical protein
MPADKFSDVCSALKAASAKLPDLAPLEDWADTADTFAADPTMDNFQQLKEASRNLSTNLRGAGINIAGDRLARSADSEAVPGRHAGSPEDEQVDSYIQRRYGERE